MMSIQSRLVQFGLPQKKPVDSSPCGACLAKKLFGSPGRNPKGRTCPHPPQQHLLFINKAKESVDTIPV